MMLANGEPAGALNSWLSDQVRVEEVVGSKTGGGRKNFAFAGSEMP